MARVQRPALQDPVARGESCLSVVGLSQNATNREVHIMFSGCEGYKKAYLAHSSVKNKVYGVVMFDCEASARRALEARAGTTWEGEDVPVRVALGRPRLEDWSPTRQRRRKPLSPARSPVSQARVASCVETRSDQQGRQPQGTKALPHAGALPRASSAVPRPARLAAGRAPGSRSPGR